ncbi:MAG: NAD+ kinase [Glaciecola sp.]
MGQRIALELHPNRSAAVSTARELTGRLEALGCQVVEVAEDGDVRDASLVLSLGGDGTFLRAAHRVRDHGVPIMGINLGTLGFLAEVEPDSLEAAIDVVSRGAWSIEERATLEVEVRGIDGGVRWRGWALNEVSVEKTARQRVLVMAIEVAGSHVTTMPADAVVISTPTGSTAYAFSAGGPILSPRVAGTLVTPVAPHSVFGRTIVAAHDEAVTVRVLPEQAAAVVSCDGRDPVSLEAGGSVNAVGSGRPVLIARVAPVDFYEVVRHKFGLR